MVVSVAGTATSATNSAGLTLTISHTIVAGTDKVLVVGVGWDNRNAQTVTGVTFNGVALTQFNFVEQVGTKARSELWYLINPAVVTANVVVTWNGTASTKPKEAGCQQLDGVDQVTPLTGSVTSVSAAADVSLSITPLTDDLSIDCATGYKGAGAPTLGASQTSRWQNGLAGTEWSGFSTVVGDGTAKTMSWTTLSGGLACAQVAAIVKSGGVAGLVEVINETENISELLLRFSALVRIANETENIPESASAPFVISGITRNSSLVVQPTCRVILLKHDGAAEGSRIYSIVGHTNSDASGNYTFIRNDEDPRYCAIYLDQQTNIVRGITDDNLQPMLA